MSDSTEIDNQKKMDALEMTKEVVALEMKLHDVLKRHIKEKNCQHCKEIIKEVWGDWKLE